MRKMWLVARQEYLGRTRQRSFLVGTLSILLMIAFVMGITALIVLGGHDSRPVGYVDSAGVFGGQVSSAAAEPAIRAFPDEAAARAELATGAIQAFYVLPEDYLSRREVTLYYGKKQPDERTRGAFDAALRSALASRLPPELQQRVSEGSHIVLRSMDGRQFDTANLLDALLPFLVGFLFILTTIASSGYLLQALTAEKENRTSEVMITTMTPMQLVGGKSAGLIAVSLTQLAVWLAVAIIVILVAGRYVPELRSLHLSPGPVAIILLYFLPAYALIAGIMTAIGAIMPDQQQGQQVAGILNLMFFFPYMVFPVILANPNGPLAVALTLFPTTAFVTVTLPAPCLR